MVSAAGGHQPSRRTVHRYDYLLGGTVCLVAAAAVVLVAVSGLSQARVACIVGSLIAAGEVSRIVLPGGREVAPVALASALSYALLLRAGDTPAAHSAAQAIAVTAAGIGAGSVPHLVAGQALHWPAKAGRLAAVIAAASLFGTLGSDVAAHGRWALLVLMISCMAVACGCDALITAAHAQRGPARFRIALANEARARTAPYAASGATAAAIALAAPGLGLAAILIFIPPVLIAQLAFRHLALTHATTWQTFRAASRTVEVAGFIPAGHAERVSRLAVAVGRELGMAEAQLRTLEYASLLHDIGQSSLREPIPGGATVLAAPADQRRIAETGAAMIRQDGILDHVAEIISHQHEPLLPNTMATRVRTEPGFRPPWLQLASQIITVASAYDDLSSAGPRAHQSTATIELLTLGSAASYDPTVVQAFRRFLFASEGWI
jgi:HD domain